MWEILFLMSSQLFPPQCCFYACWHLSDYIGALKYLVKRYIDIFSPSVLSAGRFPHFICPATSVYLQLRWWTQIYHIIITTMIQCGSASVLFAQSDISPHRDALTAVVEQINGSPLNRKTKTMSSCSTTMQIPSIDMAVMGVMGDMVSMHWFEFWQLLVSLWCAWMRATNISDQSWSNISQI